MHSIDDSEKPGRKEALQNLMSMLAGEKGKRLSGLKKKPDITAVSVEADPEHGEPDGDEVGGGYCSHCGKPV